MLIVSDDIRYMSTHDNSFIRYFKGHEGNVTCLAMNPGADTFLSCSEDNSVRVWDTNSANSCGKLFRANPHLAAFDPSANVIAIASETAQTILLYDFRNYDKEPFATFDMLQHSHEIAKNTMSKGWNKLEFSNDGKSLLVGTTGHGHFLLDAFDGGLKSYLQRDKGGPRRLPTGDHKENIAPEEQPPVSSGDSCFSPDGRYVFSGARRENVLVWDTLTPALNKRLQPIHELDMKAEAAVLAFNPRFNFFATADREVVFWVPDPHALV
jgi:COMPASS component SWD2